MQNGGAFAIISGIIGINNLTLGLSKESSDGL